MKFSVIIETPSATNPEISAKKSLSIVDKLHFVEWDFFEPPGMHTTSKSKGVTKHRNTLQVSSLKTVHWPVFGTSRHVISTRFVTV